MDNSVQIFYALHYPFLFPPLKEGKQKGACFTEPYEEKSNTYFQKCSPSTHWLEKPNCCIIYTYLHIILKYVNVRTI